MEKLNFSYFCHFLRISHDFCAFFRVVKSVLAGEECEVGENEWIQPSNIDDDAGDSDEERMRPPDETRRASRRHSSIDMPIRSGATHIMNPKDKKHMETLIIERDDSDHALQTYLTTDSNYVDEQVWIQPGSTTEEADDPEVQHNSMLQDFKESITETLHHLHLPHSHSHPKPEIKEHGLLETAMETMLMERSSMLGALPVESTDDKKFEEKRNASVESLKKLLAAPFRRRSNDSIDTAKHAKMEKFGLFDSAMKTMLIETAHIIEGVGVHPQSVDDDGEAVKVVRSTAAADDDEKMPEEHTTASASTGEIFREGVSSAKAVEGSLEMKESHQKEDDDHKKEKEYVNKKKVAPLKIIPPGDISTPPQTPSAPLSPKTESVRRNTSIDSFKKLLMAPFRRRSNDSIDLPKHVKKEKFGLFDTAMKTMLTETTHIIEGVGVHPESLDENKYLSHSSVLSSDNDEKVPQIPLQTPETSAQPMHYETESESTANDTVTNESVHGEHSALDNSTSTVALTITEPIPSIVAGNNNRFHEMPVLVLTEDDSIPIYDHITSDRVPHSVPKHLSLPQNYHDHMSPASSSSSSNNKRSPRPKRKSNLCVNPSYQPTNHQHHMLIPCKSASLINLTNKTNRLAHDVPHSTHRSHDGNGHHTKHSPSKVPNSSSAYNTATNRQPIPTVKEKDGKENKDMMCRRSSDSDLSITPKGNELIFG